MRRRECLLFAASAVLACTVASAEPPVACRDAACGGTLVYIGTRGSGPGQGIMAARLDRSTGALTSLGLAAEIERPTWLVHDPRRPVLYAVSETGNDGRSQGGVYAFRIDAVSGRLSPLNHVSSGGGGATYLSYAPGLSTLFVANYAGGQVSAIPVGPDGSPKEVRSTVTDEGTGPNRRQQGPHAHAAVVDPTGRFVLVPDLGADRVFIYAVDGARKTLSPAPLPFVALPPGSGPRHLVFSPDGHFAFLDTELTAELYAFRWDARAGRLEQVAHTALDEPDVEARSAAEIAISHDGRFLYVSNRAANQMQVFAVDRRTGALSLVQRLDSGGKVPWSFGIDPSGRWLIVTNEASSNLAVFAIDHSSGMLTATGNMLSLPKPVALAFYRR